MRVLAIVFGMLVVAVVGGGGSVEAGRASKAEQVALHLHSLYEGHFEWPFLGDRQKVLIGFGPFEMNAEGKLVAKGREYYSVEARFMPIEVSITIDPDKLTFRLEEQRGPFAFQDGTFDVGPVVGRISPDLMTLESNTAYAEWYAQPYVHLTAVLPDRPAVAAAARREYARVR